LGPLLVSWSRAEHDSLVASTAVTGAPTLLEREDALAELAAFLARGLAGEGRLVLLGGEAGIGKTELVREFSSTQAPAVRVLAGACDALFTPRPLGPLLEIAATAGGELKQLVSGEARPHEVATALLAELKHRPTLVVLEDAHWADEATLDVIRLLGRRIANTSGLFLVTYRDDEVERTDPLWIVLGELSGQAGSERVALPRLTPAAVATLAEPYEIDADDLYRKTSGNPFFVTEVLAAGSADEIPATVRDAVLARAARLSTEAKSVLEAVAVLPPQAELWLLQSLTGDERLSLEHCIASGILVPVPRGVAFRHELARLAIEESIDPSRRLELHRAALQALAAVPAGELDVARLAHHAGAAGDADAVLRYAPLAAERAAALGAHREAVAHYGRALAVNHGLSLERRAELLERRARSCYLTDQYDEGIAALEEAVNLRRSLGDPLKEGDDLRRLSEFLWCPGRIEESDARAREAVEILEDIPPSRELAWAYATLGGRCASAVHTDEAIAWSERAVALGERLGETELAVRASITLGACRSFEELERSLEFALRASLPDEAGRAFVVLAGIAAGERNHPVARKYLDAGLQHCSEHGIELYRLYLLATHAQVELHEGHWDAATDSAHTVLRIPRTSTTPRIVALTVLGLARSRRGDPDQRAPLEEAWMLAEPTGELPRLGPVAAALAEASWAVGDRDSVDDMTRSTLELAIVSRAVWRTGELSAWRRRAGIVEEVSAEIAEPYALELAGDLDGAAQLWMELGCPYERALVLANASEEEPLRTALELARELGARPLAAIVSRRLRELGVRDVPRGPRASTQANPAGLTARELDVLTLIATGLRNAEIAERLFLSRKTVDHHVSAILRKTGARTRVEAVALGSRLGLLQHG
jgi:DNA-binding CsgD family transcriptional regulator